MAGAKCGKSMDELEERDTEVRKEFLLFSYLGV